MAEQPSTLPPWTKSCLLCAKRLPLIRFNRDVLQPDCRDVVCKSCRNARIDKPERKPSKLPQDTHARCSVCGMRAVHAGARWCEEHGKRLGLVSGKSARGITAEQAWAHTGAGEVPDASLPMGAVAELQRAMRKKLGKIDPNVDHFFGPKRRFNGPSTDEALRKWRKGEKK